MTPEEIEKWKSDIQNMSHRELAYLYRFAPAGHPVFDTTLPLNDFFMERFTALGGMTSEISKAIGW